MAKTIAVTGATGAQGGSIARKMLEQGWTVRAVTRNTGSDAAKKLAEQGAEIVQASFDDESSLEKAFEGAHAIFAVTNFWEHLLGGKPATEAGEIEKAQALALARAAAKSSTLEHYIWSTLPNAKKTSGGKVGVPHLDYKAEVDEIIWKEMPELAKKTTFLFFGFYASNMAFFPFAKPIEWPQAYGAHIWVQPTAPSAKVWNAGDMMVTPGIWVSAILSQPEKSQGKYAAVAPETLSFEEHLKVWSEVTGKRATFVQCSIDEFVGIFGPAGEEYALQLKWGEIVTDWSSGVEGGFVGAEELGISPKGIGHRDALEKLKGMGLM